MSAELTKSNGETSVSLDQKEIMNENTNVLATEAAKKKKKNKNKSNSAENKDSSLTTSDLNVVLSVTENLDKVQIENNESNEEEDDIAEEGGDNAGAAKKKKKKKKKKATGETTTTTAQPVQPGQPKPAKKQTFPPTIPVCELYPTGNFPVGQIMEHPVPKDMDA